MVRISFDALSVYLTMLFNTGGTDYMALNNRKINE
jgi:hypothetical protein